MSSLFTPSQYNHGSTDDTGWVDLTLLSGWVDYDVAYFGVAAYRKRGGLVFVRGVIKSGTVTNNTQVATLPAGCRPGKNTIMSLADAGATNGFVRWDVLADGRIIGNHGLDAGHTVLTMPPFIAEN